MTLAPLEAGALRWRCDPSAFEFDDTRQAMPVEGIVGQDRAVEALRFGLETRAPGHNVFVRGLSGTGRLTLVRRLLESILPACPLAPDHCYVRNFARPEAPRLVTLSRGRGPGFRQRMSRFVAFLGERFAPSLDTPALRSRRAKLERELHEAMDALVEPFEAALKERGLTVRQVQVDGATMPAVLPLVDGRPVAPDEFEALRTSGRIDDAEAERIEHEILASNERLADVSSRMEALRTNHRTEVTALLVDEGRALLGRVLGEIRAEYPSAAVGAFLDEVADDVLTRRIHEGRDGSDDGPRYEVAVVASHGEQDACAVVVENAPLLERLVGAIQDTRLEQERRLPAHLAVVGGSLLRADGGYLVIEAKELLEQRPAWMALVRTLRSGQLEIGTSGESGLLPTPAVTPEPIPLDVKVVLIGDPGLYEMASAFDRDFDDLFKVVADFEATIPRDAQGLLLYAGVLARLQRDEHLPPLHRTAVAALAEEGARLAQRACCLTTRFGRVADLAREAAFLAARDPGTQVVTDAHVREAVERAHRRSDGPSRRFNEFVRNGVILVRTRGEAVGEANGLAVIHSGNVSFGFPTRITATAAPGQGGAVNIEREAELSGSIHTKGFYILGGLLRRLLRADHPLAFEGSVAFEQSYGGIDGDSASGIEMCCLLSALTEVPLRQDLAMTGAIDQVGNILPVGAVNEKVEGFFDTCVVTGMTGTQGVLVPAANVAELMLREDVVAACAAGRFAVHGVTTIQQALELLAGRPAGERGPEGNYPHDSLLGLAAARARAFWEAAAGTAQ
ncbi:MAG: AAA family ATPase [Planctomycetes bacterium]|nr:AAA family ATPase [Planctomycetota bacterium]